MSDPSFVLFYVEDPARSAAFYARLLDRKPVESSPTFALFAFGSGVKLGLWKRDGVEPAATLRGGGSELGFPVADDAAVDRLHHAWRTQGATVAQTPTRLDFGYTFVVLDPDGHRLRVFSPG